VQICRAVAVGFAVMGFIGYFVKLIHIPMYVLEELEERQRTDFLF
jgi:preprotein translocase subunit Sss1